MTTAEEKAKAKLLKAALLINEAHRLLIKENGGSQDVLSAEEAVLRAASGVGTLKVSHTMPMMMGVER